MSSPTPTEITPVLDVNADALGELQQRATEFNNDQRAAVSASLSEAVELMQGALDIWRDYTASPADCDDRFTAVMWIGPKRARDLHRIHLQLRELAARLTDASGVRFRDTVGMLPALDIVEAYDQSGTGNRHD